MVNDQQPMGTPKEGEKPQNIVPISLRVAPEQGRFHGVKTPEAMKQQRADEAREATKELLGDRWGATVFENPIRVPRPLPRKPGEQRGEAEPFHTTLAERPGKPSPEGSVEETGLSEELQQRENDFVARENARLANSSFTEEERQGHKEELMTLLDIQNTNVMHLKDLSRIREHMQRAGFDHPVEWLIAEGDVLVAPPGFHRFSPPRSLWRRELHQLYRDKVKEVVRYWREQGFI
jgi:hypothetical protein